MRACGDVCVCARARALKIVSRDTILRFIIIIIMMYALRVINIRLSALGDSFFKPNEHSVQPHSVRLGGLGGGWGVDFQI